MKFSGTKCLLAAAILVAAAHRDHAQDALLNDVKNFHPTDFSSETYFDKPDETKIKLRLSGAQASPLPGGLLDVRQLKVEKFFKDGNIEVTAIAPQCTYAPLDGIASSAGRIELLKGDGKFRVEGEGFLLQQTNANWSLTISNHVHTVMDFPVIEPIASEKTALSKQP